MDEEERRVERRRRAKRKERERQIAKLENRDVRYAREVAEEDAFERAAIEEAQIDAVRRREKNDLFIQKEQAIYDAQQKAFERQLAAREEEELEREQTRMMIENPARSQP